MITDKDVDGVVAFADNDKKYSCFCCLHIKQGAWLIGLVKTLGYGGASLYFLVMLRNAILLSESDPYGYAVPIYTVRLMIVFVHWLCVPTLFLGLYKGEKKLYLPIIAADMFEMGVYVAWIGLLLLGLLSCPLRVSLLNPTLFGRDFGEEQLALLDEVHVRSIIISCAVTAYAFFVDYMGLMALRQLYCYQRDRDAAEASASRCCELSGGEPLVVDSLTISPSTTALMADDA